MAEAAFVGRSRTLEGHLRAVGADGYSILEDAIDLDFVARLPQRLTQLLGYSSFNGGVGTLSAPGANRYATSAFHHPGSLLGREGSGSKPAGRSGE